jgi:hypothetical protein
MINSSRLTRGPSGPLRRPLPLPVRNKGRGGRSKNIDRLKSRARGPFRSRGCTFRGCRCGKGEMRPVGGVAAGLGEDRAGLSDAPAQGRRLQYVGPFSRGSPRPGGRWRGGAPRAAKRRNSLSSGLSEALQSAILRPGDRPMLLLKCCVVCDAVFFSRLQSAQYCGNACRQRRYRARRAFRRARAGQRRGLEPYWLFRAGRTAPAGRKAVSGPA